MGKNKDVEQIDALNSLIDQGIIDDVLGVVKSGKEATVYCCAAGGPGGDLVAAKVYRTLDERTFRNDAAYRHGRTRGSTRQERGIRLKTRTGRDLRFSQWIASEYETLRILHAAGADVPQPIAMSDRVIIMEYAGDDDGPAPMLSQVRLDGDEARPVFERIMRNIESNLACHRIHSDLSAFNILYQAGRLWIIDFPQAVDPRFNTNALELLERDVDRMCAYFDRFGVIVDARQLTRNLWGRFLRSEL